MVWLTKFSVYENSNTPIDIYLYIFILQQKKKKSEKKAKEKIAKEEHVESIQETVKKKEKKGKSGKLKKKKSSGSEIIEQTEVVDISSSNANSKVYDAHYFKTAFAKIKRGNQNAENLDPTQLLGKALFSLQECFDEALKSGILEGKKKRSRQRNDTEANTVPDSAKSKRKENTPKTEILLLGCVRLSAL